MSDDTASGKPDSGEEEAPRVFIVDDDEGFRDSMVMLCDSVGLETEAFASAAEFLRRFSPEMRGCLLLDVRMPGMSGLELQQELSRRNSRVPIVFMTGHGDIPMAVAAMKAGAADFLSKPFSHQELLDRIHRALRIGEREEEPRRREAEVREAYERLTPREQDVMHLVVQGAANKVIASRLGISQRTVEIHRAHAMEKMEADSLADLVRSAVVLGL
ncbi:MAG: DNA-binding response regulator [Acidobacteria bacterium]|nr:MAG: DNA-binding response regulator [Acidobacteriota bacterium]REK08863.1 MAG: DNA-binding response regulator [Acidobacteriota bacterium]